MPARPIFFLMLLLLVSSCATGGITYSADADNVPAISHIEPDPASGTSMATIVGEVPLVHTAQFLPIDRSGRLVEPGDLEAQTERVLANLRTALRLASADFRDLAKLNIYLLEDALREQVLHLLAKHLPEPALPAVSFVSGELSYPDALIAMDAVAVARPSPQVEMLTFLRSDALYGSPRQAHVSIMPLGGKVYVSGQAAPGTLMDATGETMKSLHATLAYLGLSARDVVQVKAFVNSMAEARQVEEAIEAHYRDRPAPPIVMTEWRSERLPIEIELIAFRRTGGEKSALTYITPPGMTTSANFSRVAEVHQGNLVYISGLYGRDGQDDVAQVGHLFATLEELLGKAGTDMNHLAKATYYHSTDEASRAINEIRPRYYDPLRPPAASKAAVRGVGKKGMAATLDMIAVGP